MSNPTDSRPAFRERFGPYIYRAVTVVVAAGLGALAAWLGIAPPPPKLVEVPVPAIDLDGARGGPAPQFAMGWLDDRDQVAQIVATLAQKSFADTPAFKGVEPVRAHLWDLALKARGGTHIPTRNQRQVGSCVSFGAVCAAEYVACVQIAGGANEKFRDLSQEIVYGGSRVQIGGGQISGDGSVGAWAAKFVQQYGLVARGVHGRYDLREYDENRCREYGRSGCPRELEPLAKERPVKSVTPVRTVPEARAAIANGYAITIASNVGFGSRGPYVRDADGFLRASGTWAHQMCLIGFQAEGRPGFYCMNSWGESWISGPSGAGNPPPGGFWIDDATVQRILSQGDSWAFSDLTGFPARKLDWAARPVRQDHDAITLLMKKRGTLCDLVSLAY